MLTASHCGNPGDSWVAGYAIGHGASLGTMSDVYTAGADIARITGKSYAGRVWLGEVDDSTTQAVKGKFNPVVGDSVCYDGAKSGQRCGNNITNADGTLCYDGACYNQEVDTVSGSHSGVIQGGDSGSPVLRGTSGGANVGGIEVAGNADKTAPCVNGTAGPCYYEDWYANVNAFLSKNPGWSIVTE